MCFSRALTGRSLRRVLRHPVLRLLLLLLFLWDTVKVLQIRSHWLSESPRPKKRPSSDRNRIFIASTHWNNEGILRSHWNNAVVSLAETFGPKNVFVSVYESGSWDNSKGALRELDEALERLGVRRNITLSETTHLDEISKEPEAEGWIKTARGKTQLRRIPYLAKLRNLVLSPLEQLSKEGIRYDTILFLNDVAFTTDDVLNLLNTNDGDYAAACSLDFSKPPSYYDTFALRDSGGHEHLMHTWPYFRSRRSRQAMESHAPVPVASCWNGMVAMPAEPFTSVMPLRFRPVPDSLATYHLEGSECCLIHADNPLSATKGVYMNPTVRVGYSGRAYDAVHSPGGFLSSWQIFKAIWQVRYYSWTTTPILKEWIVHGRVKKWRKQAKQNVVEPGEFCLINEMQVLVENGWAHV